MEEWVSTLTGCAENVGITVRVHMIGLYGTKNSTPMDVSTICTPPVLSTCPLHTNSGCGKERRILIGP